MGSTTTSSTAAAGSGTPALGGKRWSNDSAKRMIGGADSDGVFGKFGAPRWKERALYDAMKDVVAATRHVRLARVSIYDEVDGIRPDDILYRKASAPTEPVAAVISERVAKHDSQPRAFVAADSPPLPLTDGSPRAFGID